MRLALGGDRVAAREAHRLGLVTEVVDDDSVMNRAVEWAMRLAEFPPGAPAVVKRSITATRAIDPTSWLPRPDEVVTAVTEPAR